MSGISKRVSGSWVSGDYGIMKTATDTITTLPADVYADGNSATVGLVGNMSQTGTPTPDNPIMPQGTGERTGNLFDKSSDVVGYYISLAEGKWTQTESTSRSVLFKCEPNTTYTIYVPTNRTLRAVYFNNFPSAGDIGYGYTDRTTGDYVNKTLTITTSSSAQYLAFFCYNSAQEATLYDEAEYFSQIMFNTGSTALPYEPYGFEISISSASTTTPIYLGEAQTTRKVKKLVLTGEETSWSSAGGNAPYRIMLPDIVLTSDMNSVLFLSTHYLAVSNNASWSQYNTCVSWAFSGNTNVKCLQFRDTNQATLADFKTYLQQQYAAGTPVTVWYVLAEPTTGIVNEPIRKIEEYADTVSGITIPTTTGANSFDVLTTLKPSEVTANYHGWHTGAVHERENGAWT